MSPTDDRHVACPTRPCDPILRWKPWSRDILHPELSTSPPPSPSSGITTAATDQVPRWSTHPPNVNYQRCTNSKHGAQVGTKGLALGPRAPSGHLLLCEWS